MGLGGSRSQAPLGLGTFESPCEGPQSPLRGLTCWSGSLVLPLSIQRPCLELPSLLAKGSAGVRGFLAVSQTGPSSSDGTKYNCTASREGDSGLAVLGGARC